MPRILMLLAALPGDQFGQRPCGRRATDNAKTACPRRPRCPVYNANRSWHGAYSNVQWGHPVALIVPPTATMQTEYSWGVGRTQMRPIQHQFARRWHA